MALTLLRSELSKKREAVDTKFVSLSKPPEELLDTQEQAENVENRFRRRAMTLDEDVQADLEYKLWYEVQDWKDSRATLKSKLRDLNDLYEGVVRVTDFPWPGASQIHVPIPKIKAREIRSTINRNTMRPVPFLMCKYAGPDSLYENSMPVVNSMEDFVEDKIKNGTNVHQTLKDAIIPTIRDGTCPVQIIWETELERVTDYKLYSSVQDFTNDYPSAEDAGIGAKQYSKILNALNKDQRYEVQYEYDMAVYDGPKAYIVPLIHFFHWPVFETEIAYMLTHGKRVWYTDYDLEKFISMGKFDKDVTEMILKSPGDLHDDESLTISRDQIEGINRNPGKNLKAKEYEFYELVHRVDLDDDGVKEKYLIYWHYRSRKIVRIEKYPIRKGATTYFPLRLVRRDNRFLGISLIEDIADLSLEIDILHRMRINSRTITHVPAFKAKSAAKDKFDPSRPQFRFQPGVTFWLNDVADVEQFDIRPVDLSGSIEEENFLMQIVNLVTGSDSGLSGASNPIDPRAPARKQQEMLRQSSNRIDDYVEALLGPFAQIGQFMLDLYYQYGPERIKYFVEDDKGGMLQKEIDRAMLFNPNVMFTVNGTSVFMNPEMEFDRVQQVMQTLATSPITAQDPKVQRNILERYLYAARIPDTKGLMPDPQGTAAVGMQTPAGPMLPTQADKEMQMKIAVQKEKNAAKIGDAALQHQHEKELAVIQGAVEAANAPPETPVPALAA